MSKWIYDGYTKVKQGSGRSAKMVETWIYKCPNCNHTIRLEWSRRHQTPSKCPN